MHDISQHLTGLSTGQIIPVGQRLISLAQEKSKGHTILSEGQVLDCPDSGDLHFDWSFAQLPSQHLTYPVGQVVGVGHRNFAVVQVPSGHLVIVLSIHCVSSLALTQLSLIILQEPSLQSILKEFGHFSKEGQSSRDFLQSPLGHLIGMKEGQLKILGHSLKFETHELSGHLTL